MRMQASMRSRLVILSLLLIFTFISSQSLPVAAHSPKQQPQQPTAAPTNSQNDKQPQKQDDKDNDLVYREGTKLVNINVTVTDPYGRYGTGLSKENFEVYDDKVPQEIKFFSDEDAPISIGVLFDVSGSMKGRIDRSEEALQKFCDAGHERDEYFLVTFNSGARLTQDFTPDSHIITSSLLMVEPKGQTALYDAAYIGIEKVRHGRYQRKALLLISDGQDNNSRYTFRELKQLIKEADVQIYAIGITNVFSPHELDVDGQVVMEELTRLTGGRAFFPNNDAELTEVITRIGLELRHQYSIGYEPTGVAATNNTDNHWHKIHIKVKAPKGMPNLSLRTREGYFSQSHASQQ